MSSSFALGAALLFLLPCQDGKIDGAKKAAATPVAADERPWTTGLRRTLAESLRTGKPILVRAGAPWCGWCEKLSQELRDPTLQQEFERWSLAYVDTDRDTSDARRLGIGPIPALRILTAEGRPVAARDGFMKADELAAWLKEQFDNAAVKPSDELLDSATPTGAALARLVRELEQRDAVLREAAIRRLVSSPSTTAAAVAKALEDGSLQAKLSAFDVLAEWKAPVGDLDPWRSESFTPPRLAALREWVKKVPTTGDKKDPGPLTAAERAAVVAEIDRMLAAPAEDVPAFRERLARQGKRITPLVYEAFKKADSDAARQRLTALRYRVAASPALALHWRSGLERLSAPENSVRHQAAEELVQRSGAAEEDLLLELFGDEDPLVRELALRGLHEASGGGVAGTLVRLLQDPSPNVRAAVLKLLAEHPTASLVPKLAEYVKTESDPDLVVHAVRVFRETKSKSANDALLDLFKHPNWRVRAEALEAIGGAIGKHFEPENADKLAAFEACLAVLEDSDPFVAGKAASVLEHDNRASVVKPLVKAVERQPTLAASVLVALANGANTSGPAAAHFHRLAKSSDPLHRAAALTALAATNGESFEEEAKAGLVDSVPSVRIAALNAMYSELERLRTPQANRLNSEPEPPTPAMLPRPVANQEEPADDGGIFGLITGLWRSSPPPRIVPAKIPDPPPATKTMNAKKADATKTETKPKADSVKPPQESMKKADSKPKAEAEKKPEPPAKTGESEYDEWLANFRKGQKRPQWMVAQKAPIDKCLAAADADERLAASLVAMALGTNDTAIPTLLKAVAERPSLLSRAAEALPWQPWSQRLDLFRKLTLRIAPEDLAPIATAMAEVRDPRAEDPLWALFDGGPRDERIAADVYSALQHLLFGSYYYDPTRIPGVDRKAAAKSMAKRVEQGPEWARVCALALYTVADRDAADAVAEKWIADKKTSASLRRDAMQLRLLLMDKSEARKLAVQTVKEADEGVLEPALVSLAMGRQELRRLRQTFDLYNIVPYESTSVQSGEKGKIPEPPKGLAVEMLRPLLTKAGPRGAAIAGYFLVLLDEPEGLDPLVNYFRKNAATDADWARLVYQAIAYGGEDRHVAVLEQIYTRLTGKYQFNIADMYWAMRPMEGPRAKALRARIRKEVGMASLQ